MSYKIGIVGLGVMGQNLALNMERNGFPVAGYDLDKTKTRPFWRVRPKVRTSSLWIARKR